MSVHTNFIIAACVAFGLTLPVVLAAWLRLPRVRALVVSYYVAGFALIAAQLTIDSFVNPPLFLHGFMPGIGVAFIIIALVLARAD